MDVWTIFDSPPYYPGKLVLRRVHLGDCHPLFGWRTTWICRDLADARRLVPPGLRHVPRKPGDAPCVVESWL